MKPKSEQYGGLRVKFDLVKVIYMHKICGDCFIKLFVFSVLENKRKRYYLIN